MKLSKIWDNSPRFPFSIHKGISHYKPELSSGQQFTPDNLRQNDLTEPIWTAVEGDDGADGVGTPTFQLEPPGLKQAEI